MRRAQLAVFALTVLAGLVGRTYAQSGQKALIDLGPGTRAYGINATGQVTGCLSIAAGGTHAFLYAAGTLTDLGTLGGVSSCGLAINTSGQIAGYADTGADRHAFVYASGIMTDLTAVSGMPTTTGLAINTAGDVVGAAPQFGGTTVAILYSHGVVTNLFPPNIDYVGSVATVINDSGVIAGYTTGPCGILCPTYQPFTIENGVTTYLPLPPGSDGQVFDPLIAGINNAGQMVAWGEDPAGFYHGSVYSNGTPVDLGNNTTAYAINASGEVVGNSNVARLGLGIPDVGVFVYNAGVTTDLNLPGLNPTGINDAGWIIGNHGVLDHAYLLLPSSVGLAPTGVTFGNEPISVPSTQGKPTCGSCAVTLSNASAAAVAVDNIVATQPYSVTHNCPASLNAGATCTISVTFTPTALGPQAGALTVDAGSTAYATLLQGSGAILMELTAGNAPAVVDQPFTISWQAGTGATCTSSGGSWDTPFNSLPASGSRAITESVAATYTYTLTCSYGSGVNLQAQAQLVVVVQPAPSSGGGGGGSADPWILGILVTLRAARRRATARIQSAHSVCGATQSVRISVRAGQSSTSP
jgi:probable HAF family extracellular repeat protein